MQERKREQEEWRSWLKRACGRADAWIRRGPSTLRVDTLARVRSG